MSANIEAILDQCCDFDYIDWLKLASAALDQANAFDNDPPKNDNPQLHYCQATDEASDEAIDKAFSKLTGTYGIIAQHSSKYYR